MMNNDKLVIGGHEFNSRFILGSGKYSMKLIRCLSAGYVADELKTVFPECVVSVPQDKEKCGYEELYQVQDTSMIKYLGKAIQELYSIIESQQKEIDELKKRVNAN